MRHHDVQQNNIRIFSINRLKRFPRIGDRHELAISIGSQKSSNHANDQRLVIDDHDFGRPQCFVLLINRHSADWLAKSLLCVTRETYRSTNGLRSIVHRVHLKSRKGVKESSSERESPSGSYRPNNTVKNH